MARHDPSIPDLKRWIHDELVVPGLGIADATEEELTTVALYPALAQPALAKMISDRAQIGWSTHGHSAVDVNIYSYSYSPVGGPAAADALRGNVENTDVGRFLREYLGVDVDAVTQELREKRGRGDGAAKQQQQQRPEDDDENMGSRAGAGAADDGVDGSDKGEAESQPEVPDHWAAHEELEAHRLEEEEAQEEAGR